MADLFAESIESDDTQYGIDGYEIRRDRVRIFHTTYKTREAAESDARCPKLYDPHPSDSFAWCIRKEARHVSDGSIDMVCHYRWNGEGGIPEKGFSVKTAKVSLPIFNLHSKPINNFTGSIVRSWEPADAKYTEIEEQYLVYTFGRRIPKLTPTDISLIVSQHRHLHIIDGVHYQFMPPVVISVDQATDHITYMWIHDNGTLSPRQFPDWVEDPALAFPPDRTPLAQDDFFRIRDPYTYLVPVFGDPSTTGIPPKPTILQLWSGINVQADYDKWRDLPGMYDQ